MAKKQFFAVSRKFIHPDYLPSTNENDIAIMELEESVKMSDSIKPACIATDYNEIESDSGTVVTSGAIHKPCGPFFGLF